MKKIGNTKHNGCYTRLYSIRQNMKSRCYNRNHIEYANYGGRGITICEEWKNSFEAFRDWALSHGYADNLSIDRIDNDGNYTPENCRWATKKEQANNRKSNRLITYNGKTQNLKQWADESGIDYKILHDRITRYKWSAEKALTTPCRKMRRKQRARA